MELLWIGLFVALCIAIGGLVVGCDLLAPSDTAAPSKGAP